MAHGSGNVLTLLLVEGDTEEIFYRRIKEGCLDEHCSVKIENLEGTFGVNRNILKILATKYRDRRIRIYCCLDKETRYGQIQGFGLEYLRTVLVEKGDGHVLSVDAIIATQMIESWFFHDQNGIYSFLEVPRSKRKDKAFQPVERLREKDLKMLFERYGKTYNEGRRATAFINSLDLDEIIRRCKDLRDGIDLIKSYGRD